MKIQINKNNELTEKIDKLSKDIIEKNNSITELKKKEKITTKQQNLAKIYQERMYIIIFIVILLKKIMKNK